MAEFQFFSLALIGNPDKILKLHLFGLKVQKQKKAITEATMLPNQPRYFDAQALDRAIAIRSAHSHSPQVFRFHNKKTK